MKETYERGCRKERCPVGQMQRERWTRSLLLLDVCGVAYSRMLIVRSLCLGDQALGLSHGCQLNGGVNGYVARVDDDVIKLGI